MKRVGGDGRPPGASSQDLNGFVRESNTMWRHGDVFIEACKEVPVEAKRLPHLLLAKGELTGHAHRIERNRGACLFEAGDERFLDVTDESITIVHEEHAPITLARGTYRVWIQREYSPEAIRRVMD